MPLFLCGCVEGPELLTNTPLTHLFPCASTLDLALFYSISHGTIVHFDPKDILCILNTWSSSRLKGNRQELFPVLCTFITLKGQTTKADKRQTANLQS